MNQTEFDAIRQLMEKNIEKKKKDEGISDASTTLLKLVLPSSERAKREYVLGLLIVGAHIRAVNDTLQTIASHYSLKYEPIQRDYI